MISINVENPKIEALLERFLVSFLPEVVVTHEKSPTVLKKLPEPITDIHTGLKQDFPKITGPVIDELVQSAEKADHFIEHRKAFTLNDVTNGDHKKRPDYGQRFKAWLMEDKRVISEQLLHLTGHPWLFVPFWEFNHKTYFADNAMNFKCRMVSVAKGKMDAQDLSIDERNTLKSLGFALF
jgi:hypothetical protein